MSDRNNSFAAIVPGFHPGPGLVALLNSLRSAIPGPAELAFLGMIASVALAEVLFILKFSLSPLPFWFGVLISMSLAGLKSKKCLFWLLVIYAFGLFLSFAGESYFTTDAMKAYFPMQRILAEGWNPVWEMSQDKICAYAGTKIVGSYYIEYCPHLTALVAAMVDRTFGLFSADPFCGIVMMSVVGSLAYRLAIAVWHSRWVAVALALSIAVTTKITNFLSGHVDYTIYAMMMVALLSGGLWVCSRRKTDLLIFMAAAGGAMASKATGVPFAIVCCAAMIAYSWKDRGFWRVFLPGLLIVALLCVSPYIVNVVHHGSPFPTVDLTDDFVGNADAMRMGWLLKCIYAWVSPQVAIGVGKIFYGSDFMPVFSRSITSFEPIYRWFFVIRWLLFVSLLAVIMGKKNVVVVICLLIFATCNLMPTRYIGFVRYCPQLWCLPILAILNFLFTYEVKSYVVQVVIRAGKVVTISAIFTLSCFILLRTAAYYERCIAWHSARVHELEKMVAKSKQWRIEESRDLEIGTAVKLCTWNGIDIVADPDAPSAAVFAKYAIVSALPIDPAVIERFGSKFGILNSPGAMMRFDWLAAFKNPRFE